MRWKEESEIFSLSEYVKLYLKYIFVKLKLKSLSFRKDSSPLRIQIRYKFHSATWNAFINF